MSAIWVIPEELEEASDSPYALEACRTASYILWAFSGRKFSGIRTVTERYELPCVQTSLLGTVYPTLTGEGAVVNKVGRDGSCGCSGAVGGVHTRMRLRGAPVRAVSRVSISGRILDPTEYKIVNGNVLQLTGTGINIDGIEVTYSYGVNPPVAGQKAARLLARELAKGFAGEDCSLPDRVTNVNRQGFSFTVLDPQDFLDSGRTGIYEVDLFLKASNPDNARKPSKVFSVDRPKAYRVTAGKVAEVLGPYDFKVNRGEAAILSIDLASLGLDSILTGSLNPLGQIGTPMGALLFEFKSTRFQITDGILEVNLTAEETSSLSGNKVIWDLYGVNALDGVTVSHLMSSKIFIGE